MFQRVYQFFSIHNFGSFASASKTIPLFMHFKDSTLSGRFTIAQVFTTLHFMSNQIYMLSDRKMYMFSNYYTTIRPIWNLKETWKKVISLNTILFAIKHATRGMWFQPGHPEVEWRTRYLVCYILVIKNVLTSVCVCFKSFYHSYVCFWNWQRQVGKFIPRIQRNPN